MQIYHHNNIFRLESGGVLTNLAIAYHTWGELNQNKDNVIWVCHALTASSNAVEWWPNLIGDGLTFDTKNYFVICANILGSCYGTTGPTSIDAQTALPYFSQFPFITIRDMVQAHEVLRQHLGITGLHLLAGGSMGGYQALEWCVQMPTLSKHLFLLATSAKETAWGIAIHTAQRMAIETDETWGQPLATAGAKGLKVARSIGILTYRSYESFIKTQTDEDMNKLDDFKASSYLEHQGNKLVKRFNAHCYWLLTKAMDTHNVARNRGDLVYVLNGMPTKTLVVGITSDVLCPLEEQQFLADKIPKATFVAINSLYGHDGFLVETEQISRHFSLWLNA